MTNVADRITVNIYKKVICNLFEVGKPYATSFSLKDQRITLDWLLRRVVVLVPHREHAMTLALQDLAR